MSGSRQEFFESHDAFEENGLETAVPHRDFHEVLYGMISRHCPPARILGVGCGLGWALLYLSGLLSGKVKSQISGR